MSIQTHEQLNKIIDNIEKIDNDERQCIERSNLIYHLMMNKDQFEAEDAHGNP